MADETTLTSVPDIKLKEGELPDHYQQINNLAGDKELVDQVRSWTNTNIQFFLNQGQRKKQTDAYGNLDVADRMYRISLNIKTSSSQVQPTLSDFTSTMYNRQVKTLSSGEISIFLEENKLPAKFEPVLDSGEYTSEQGKWISSQQNMLEEITFEEDDRRAKLEDIITYNNKNGNEMVSVEWERVEKITTERVPTEWSADNDAIPTKFDFVEKKRVTKDCPTLNRWPLQNCYFDAQIDDMNLQRCFAVRKQFAYEKLLEDQEQGFIMNVNKISTANLAFGNSEYDEVLDQTLVNAGEDADVEADGLYEVWDCWVRVPIKEKKTKLGGKGTWSPDKVPPTLYWATFVGDIAGDAVCVRLIKNPYFHQQIPYKLIHAYQDDKGAYHMSLSQMLQSLYWQVTTNLNQAADNVTLRNKAPYVTDGKIFTKDLTSKANKLIRTARGVKLEPIKVMESTQITLQLAKLLEEDADKTSGADKPIQGEKLGSRTSATESKKVFEQAMKPLLVKAEYVAEQLFKWMFELDYNLWRQFGDPEKILSVTKNNQIQEVKPTSLWGPIKIKITSILNYETNQNKRVNINSFIQNGFAAAQRSMGLSGESFFWREALRIFGFDNINEIIPPGGDFDAKNVALDEIYKIMQVDPLTEELLLEVMPKPEQNQLAHLSIEEPKLKEYELLPTPEDNAEASELEARIQMLRDHIELEKIFLSEKQNPQNAVQPGQQGQEGQQGSLSNQEGLPGEISGGQIAAAEGATANL